MQIILLIITCIAAFAWWYYMQLYMENNYANDQITDKQSGIKRFLYMKSVLLLFGLLFISVTGSILFPVYEYGVVKIIRYFILMFAVVLIALIDRRAYIIPNKILLLLLGIRGILLMIECVLNLESGYLKTIVLSPLTGFLIGGGIFFVCYILTRKAVGEGDIKLFAVIGFYVGSGVLFPLLLISAFISAVYGITMVLIRKMKMTDYIPFAPFAAIGTILTLLIGF
ncbi:MAG: prepilin peptidase [Blautia sp.]